jgi:5-methylcytosine-specific restriction endonuclease McrA
MTPYGYRWRTVTTLAILRRDGGRFERVDGRERYRGAAKCLHCGWIDCLHGGRREVDVAHLVIPWGEPGHDDETNLGTLCRKCHKAHDRPSWAPKLKAHFEQEKLRRIEEKDRSRPILEFLQEKSCEA